MIEQGLTPEELATLIRRLDALIDEARVLQARIAERLRVDHERVESKPADRAERRRRRRSTVRD